MSFDVDERLDVDIATRGSKMRTSNRASPRAPRVGVLLDALGLVTAAWLATLRLSNGEGLAFAGLLVTFGAGTWLMLAQHRSLATVLTKQNPRLLLSPLIAAVAVLALQAITRGYYSLGALLVFTACWGAWMVLVRALRLREGPKTTLLVPGTPRYVDQLRALPNVDVFRAFTPPDSVRGIDVVITEPMEAYSEEWLYWFMHADLAGIRLVSSPLALEYLSGKTPVESLRDRWAEGTVAANTGYERWKRLMDVTFIVLASPLILVVVGAVAGVVALGSGRPVLFRQERVGKGGRSFQMLKFRTMGRDAEMNGPAFADRSDLRVTRVGAILRKLRFDEIPQFWNVLKGDMSIIGPRPEQEGFATMFEARLPHYGLRHTTRPGITGWAQVVQGYAADDQETSEKLRYDLYYVRHRSFLLDLEIVVRTLGVVLNGFGSR